MAKVKVIVNNNGTFNADSLKYTEGTDGFWQGLEGNDTITIAGNDISVDGGAGKDKITIDWKLAKNATIKIDGEEVDTITFKNAKLANFIVELVGGDLILTDRNNLEDKLTLSGWNNWPEDFRETTKALVFADGARTWDFVNKLAAGELWGSDAADKLTVNGTEGAGVYAEVNYINAGKGKDTVTVTAKDDITIDLVGGANTVKATKVNDIKINGGIGTDTVNVTGADEFHYTSNEAQTGVAKITAVDALNIDVATGAGKDVITLKNVDGGFVKTGAGNDTINVSADSMTLDVFGGEGNDIINVTDSISISVDGGAGADTVKITRSDDAKVHAGAGDDKITVVSGNEAYIEGGAGNDKISIDWKLAKDATVVIDNDGVDTITVKNAKLAAFDIQYNEVEDKLVLTDSEEHTLTFENWSQWSTAEGARETSKSFVFADGSKTWEYIDGLAGGVLYGTTGKDKLNVNADSFSYVHEINAKAGNDIINVTDVKDVDVYLVSGTNTVTVKNADDIFVTGGSGADTVNVTGGASVGYDVSDYAESKGVKKINLTDVNEASVLTAAGADVITMKGVNNANIITGAGVDTITVSGTQDLMGSDITIDGGEGADKINVYMGINDNITIKGDAADILTFKNTKVTDIVLQYDEAEGTMTIMDKDGHALHITNWEDVINGTTKKNFVFADGAKTGAFLDNLSKSYIAGSTLADTITIAGGANPTAAVGKVVYKLNGNNDRIYVDADGGADTINVKNVDAIVVGGGDGNDCIIVNEADRVEVLGGSGNDVLSVANAKNAVLTGDGGSDIYNVDWNSCQNVIIRDGHVSNANDKDVLVLKGIKSTDANYSLRTGIDSNLLTISDAEHELTIEYAENNILHKVVFDDSEKNIAEIMELAEASSMNVISLTDQEEYYATEANDCFKLELMEGIETNYYTLHGFDIGDRLDFAALGKDTVVTYYRGSDSKDLTLYVSRGIEDDTYMNSEIILCDFFDNEIVTGLCELKINNEKHLVISDGYSGCLNEVGNYDSYVFAGGNFAATVAYDDSNKILNLSQYDFEPIECIQAAKDNKNLLLYVGMHGADDDGNLYVMDKGTIILNEYFKNVTPVNLELWMGVKADLMAGTEQDDTITLDSTTLYYADAGNDVITINSDSNIVFAGDGHDTINVNGDYDLGIIDAGDGDDNIIVNSGFYGAINCGNGNDTVALDLKNYKQLLEDDSCNDYYDIDIYVNADDKEADKLILKNITSEGFSYEEYEGILYIAYNENVLLRVKGWVDNPLSEIKFDDRSYSYEEIYKDVYGVSPVKPGELNNVNIVYNGDWDMTDNEYDASIGSMNYILPPADMCYEGGVVIYNLGADDRIDVSALLSSNNVIRKKVECDDECADKERISLSLYQYLENGEYDYLAGLILMDFMKGEDVKTLNFSDESITVVGCGATGVLDAVSLGNKLYFLDTDGVEPLNVTLSNYNDNTLLDVEDLYKAWNDTPVPMEAVRNGNDLLFNFKMERQNPEGEDLDDLIVDAKITLKDYFENSVYAKPILSMDISEGLHGNYTLVVRENTSGDAIGLDTAYDETKSQGTIVFTGKGNDTITATKGNHVIFSGVGDDIIEVKNASDSNGSNVSVYAGSGKNTITLEGVNEARVEVSEGIDNEINISCVGEESNVHVCGGLGDDIINVTNTSWVMVEAGTGNNSVNFDSVASFCIEDNIGNDIYSFDLRTISSGYFEDNNGKAAGESDTIVFSDVSSTDVNVYKSWGALCFSLKAGGSGEVSIYDFEASSFDNFQFSDTTLTREDVLKISSSK